MVLEEFRLLSRALTYLRCRPQNKFQRDCSQIRLFFLAYCEDTNILRRGGYDKYRIVRSRAKRALSKGGVYSQRGLKEISELDEYMKQHWLSAAGAGDMMILLLLVKYLDAKNFVRS